MNDFQKIKKIDDDRAKFKRYCKCGHSIVFTPINKANKIPCSWCGNYIYKNDLEEFKDKIIKISKKY